MRVAVRTLRKNPGFTLAAVLIIALGIGANSAMFSVIRAVLLKPLAYREPDRVVQVSGGSTIAHFEEMKAAQRSYSDFAAESRIPLNVNLSGPDGAEALKAAPVSANFLQVLGVQPLLGRGFLPEEDAAGGPRVAMISAGLWQRRFDGDLHISGKTATISTAVYTIVGVLPTGFAFPSAGIDVWITRPEESVDAYSPLLQMFGRLKPGVSLSQASAELAVLNQHYRAAHPTMLDAKPPTAPERVTPLKDTVVNSVRATLWMLAGAVGLVLLIACSNIAGLLLARASARSREFAVRAALGAPRLLLVRQLLIESVLLACAGGLLGLGLASAGLRVLAHMTTLGLPRAGEVQLDGSVLAFTAILSLGAGLLFGLFPALGSSRPDLAAVLRASGEAANASGRRRLALGLSARGILVMAQMALSVILLSGAALLMESIVRLRQVNPGLDTHNVLTMQIALPPVRYSTPSRQMAFYDELVRRVEAIPGVRSAAFAFSLPFAPYPLTPVQPADQARAPLNQRPLGAIQNVTPDYFQTLRIPLRRGREITQRDDPAAPLVVVINEALARMFWPAYPTGPEPIGQRILIGARTDPVEIVGIVADAQQWLGADAKPAMYRPLAQYTNAGALLLRTEGDPQRFANEVRAQVQAIDSDQAVSAVQSLESMKDAEFGQQHAILALLVFFAGAAMLLALTGIYGVIAYSVAQRTEELGIRRALGAGHSDILRLVLAQALGLTIGGVVVGLAGAAALTRFLKSLLFNTNPIDPVAFIAIPAAFLIAALFASYIPARRAARIDPMRALRA